VIRERTLEGWGARKGWLEGKNLQFKQKLGDLPNKLIFRENRGMIGGILKETSINSGMGTRIRMMD